MKMVEDDGVIRPTVLGWLTRGKRGNLIYHVDPCPCCGGSHIHSWSGTDLDSVSHRIAHCLRKDIQTCDNYYISLDPSLKDYHSRLLGLTRAPAPKPAPKLARKQR